MPSLVYMFNAAPAMLRVVVNNGQEFRIPAVASSQGWYPMPAPTPPPFTGTIPAPGAFGYGLNQCAITPATGGATNTLPITVPTGVNPVDALQMYLFYVDDQHTSWVLLDNGRAVAGNLSLSPAMPSA